MIRTTYNYITFSILLLIIIPFLPHDIISYVIGTTTISRKKFILATLFGFLIHSSIHNYVGDSLYKGEFTIGFFLVIGFFLLSGIIVLSKNKIIEHFLNEKFK